MIPLVKPYIAPKDEVMPALESELYSGYIASGKTVEEFERVLSGYLGSENVVALNSGSAALHIALLLAGVKPGDEVISTAMTAEPTNTVIAQTGAKIVWADVDLATGLASPDSIAESISERTRAIVIVHYAGMVCDMKRINEVSDRCGIPVIEDAAHSFGARFEGKRIGSNSQFTCFSFQAIKQLTTVDGGALTLKDPALLGEARQLRWFGLDKHVSRLENDIKRIGYKYAMNNVTAAFGLVQMRHIDNVVSRCIENGKFYDEALRSVPGVELVPYYPDTEPSYWLYTMKVERRDEFERMMEGKGITASPLHHRSDTHSVFSESRRSLPGLDEWYGSFVHIPCGWWVNEEKRAIIVDAIKGGW